MATPLGPRVGVDVGGTFTDLVSIADDGRVTLAKVPSTPADPGEAVWQAVDAAAVMPATLIHGSTVATNALLERRGARVTLVTTAGFEDLLWLRRQDRAALYDLGADHPAPLVAREHVIGVAERIGAEGVVVPLADTEVTRVVQLVVASAPESVAIGLLFAFQDPAHEHRLAEALRVALGDDVPVVLSSEVLPVWREYERFSTTVAEAYLRPPVGRYLTRLGAEGARRGLAELRVMASHGGTLDVAQAVTRAARLTLSGPAGGVEAAGQLGRLLDLPGLLTLDMGGTSADVSLVTGGVAAREASGQVGGVPVALPHVLIETVGAGGGSVAWVDAGHALRVGPRSAGAQPGPACYGRGGDEATVTDAAVVLGWMDANQPLASGLQLDVGAAERAVARVAEATGLSVMRCAEGIVDVAVATMVRALRRVSVERGVDPRGLSLCAFGGAGPLFVCRVADALGVPRAVVPPHAGVFSALGLAMAAPRLEGSRSVHQPAHQLSTAALADYTRDLRAAFARELPGGQVSVWADCRYPGQGTEMTVPCPSGAAAATAFHAAHEGRYGHGDRTMPVDVINVRVVATGEAPIVTLAQHASDEVHAGPHTMHLPDATLRIEAGWVARRHGTGAWLLERVP